MDKMPAHTERTITSARVVGKRQLGTEPGPPRAGVNGYAHGAGAGDRVGGEFLADAADGAAAFGKGNGWRLYLVIT